MVDKIELKKFIEAVIMRKRLLLSLYKRIALIRTEYALKSDFEKNEIDILEIKTIISISRLKKNISISENKILEQFKSLEKQ